MSILAVATTTLIALYAMVGGAFLSAAITSPRNCLIAISMLWAMVIEWFIIGAITLLLIGALVLFSSVDAQTFAPFIWLGAAHIGWFGLMTLCRALAERIDQAQTGETAPEQHH